MIKKRILNAQRIRRIDGGFSFIPHRFLTEGFFSALDPDQLLLYFFLVIAGDRNGLSFYSYDSICNLLKISLDQYLKARDALIDNDFIAFDGTIFQVLDLPEASPAATLNPKSRISEINHLIAKTLKKVPG
ncbi:MAG: hypothetical protein PVG41_07765 [Desulfobacteraceae bacterium]|jgi:hypothetical protein